MFDASFRRSVRSGLILCMAFFFLGGAQSRAQEAWDAVFLKGNKIGFVHTFVEKVSERLKDGKTRELYRVRQDQVFTFRRLNDTVTMKMMYGTIETSDGEVLRLDTRTLTSENELRVHGDAIRGKMKLKLDSGNGVRQEQVIDWGKDVRGPYAAEQSMAKKPMSEGETRAIKMYIPDLNRIVDFTFKAEPVADVMLGDGTNHPLRKVVQTASLDGKRLAVLDAVLWADSGGQVLKLETDMMGGIVMYRTTKEGATGPLAQGNDRFDEIKSTIIAVGKIIPDPRRTTYVQYRITVKGEDPTEIFPADRRQTIQGHPDKNSLILNVNTAGPDDGAPGPAEVDAQYTRSNGILSSDDEQVRDLARRAVRDAQTPWDKAVRIEHWVFENIRDKNFGIAFAPAHEVARNLSGDCSEHAVLAAAMSRAVGIPSRVAVGLLYVDNPQQKIKGFGYHVWHELYVNQRWVALDSSWDQSSVDATHIKLGDTSLDGVAPFQAFLPVARVSDKLEIDPIELR
ncbi:MAG: transglutaminase-like domain-containing protein [Isosphaeraceae bacterium]